MSTAAPVRGRLASSPLPELLGALWQERLTGVLRLRLPSGPGEIYFTGGYAAAVELPGGIDRIAELLAASGAIDPAVVERTLAAPRPPGLRYGQMLVDAGLLPVAQLQAALRLQVRRRLHRLFFAEEGDFVIERGEHGRGTEGGEPIAIDLRRVVLQGVRSAWSEARFGARLPATPLTLASELAPYGLSAPEQALLAPLARTPATLAALVSATAPAPADAMRALVYALLSTGALATPSTAAAPAPPAEPPRSSPPYATPPRASAPATPRTITPPPAGSPPRANTPPPAANTPRGSGPPITPRTLAPPPAPHTSRAPAAGSTSQAAPAAQSPNAPTSFSLTAATAISRAIADKRAVVDGENLFQVLAVTREASRDDVKKAYLEAARIYHPDRLAAAGLIHLRADAEHIFRRVSEAQATLGDDARRAAYLERLDEPPGMQAQREEAQRVIQAEMALVEGEVALKRRDFAGAIERLSEAVQMNPAEGEALALLAWARFAAGQAQLSAVRGDFERAVTLSPMCARAHFYLGMARKQGGDPGGALSSFRRAAELDPRMAEALSEIRVLAARQTREQPSMRGLLDRLKKK